jgi:hypothetical protein
LRYPASRSRASPCGLGHLLSAFSVLIRTLNFPISLSVVCRAGPDGIFLAVCNNFAHISSSSRNDPFSAILVSSFFEIICVHRHPHLDTKPP